MSDTVELKHCPKCGAPIPAGAPQGLCPKCVLVGAASGSEGGVPGTATAEVPSLERVAAAFPQLEIVELIGRGGMGFVFKARQPHLDRFVALKLLPDKLAQDPRFAERFNREGRMLARLNHPNIVTVYDFGQTEHFYFLLMEFVDGVNLRQAMQAGRFSPGEALAIVPKVCEALQYAHSQGILHRDIKPENILLDSHGHVKIADFGIAKLVGDDKSDVSLTQTGAAIGSPHYMAPEQLEKPADVDHRADIYSLGVVFYEMLTGELPIGRFAAPSSKTPVSASVDDVVFRTLEKDREKRYQSAGEVKSQVEHLTHTGTAASGAEPPKIPIADAGVPEWSQKSVWAAVLTALSLPLLLPLLIVLYLGVGGLGWLPRILAFGVISLPGVIGCILGWMALSDIRAYQGRLRGLPLAVFGALAWPLFLLVGVTVLAPWLVIHTSVAGASPTGIIPAGLLALLVPVGTITFAIWAVYAAVRWGANKPVSQRRGVLKWVFSGLVIAGIGFVCFVFARGSASRTASPNTGRPAPALRMEAAVPSARAPSTVAEQPASFGLMREIVLPEPDTGVACLLDFETGKLFAPPEALADRLRVGMAEIGGESVSWLRNSGADAVVNMPNAGSLRLFEGVALSVAHKPNPPLRWGQFTPTEVISALSQASFERSQRFQNSETTFYATSALSPDALAFITREGSMGVMEIMGLSKDPRGVKLRYKLVQRVSPGVPPVAYAVQLERTDLNHQASEELWTPELAQGEQPDPQKILDEARQLTAQRRYEDALQRHIWYHNHALQYRPSQAGVRLSFALVYWMELARVYPNAKQALIEIRDLGMTEFAGSGGSFAPFMEVSAINRELGDQNATYALFKSIQLRNPKLARQCYPLTEDLLVEKGEYALCASFIPNFHNRFENARAARERSLAAADRTPEMQVLMRNQADRTFIKETRKLIEILVGVGRKAEAEEIREEALTISDVPELKSAVTDAEHQVAKHSGAAANVRFEPTLGVEDEATVPDLFSGGAQLALGRKQSVRLPPEGKKWNRTTLLNWLADEGVDLAAIHYDDDQYGWGIAMRPPSRHIDVSWSRMTIPILAEAATRSDMPLEKIDEVTDRMKLYRLFPASVPMSFVIRTHTGREGILQIVGTTNNPPALKVRYRLVIPPAVEEP